MKNSPLGKDYEICGHFERDSESAASSTATMSAGSGIVNGDYASSQFNKWQLQEAAIRLLPKTRITACHRVVGYGHSGVAIKSDNDKAWYAGLAVCASPWNCAVCARKIGEHKRDELQRALDKAIGQGMGAALTTLTFSHSIRDSLADIMPRLTEARRKMTGWRSWKNLKKKYGLVGGVKALEITHGRNGWHPHTHEIQFTKQPLDDHQLAEMQDAIFTIWRRVCEVVGLPLPNAEHGVDVRGANRAAQYIGKWGFASELTRSTSKHGKWSGRNPWELLADYRNGDRQAGALFAEYAGVFKGRAQLYWSPGLRDLLQIGELFSDEDLAGLDDFSDNPAQVVQIAFIDAPTWAVICSKGARAQVLDIALRGEAELSAWLDRLRWNLPFRTMIHDWAVDRRAGIAPPVWPPIPNDFIN